ncbi:MAG: hypothetical protein II812_09220 [Prevotella sp.]|nr:hypothetical protein [Prevotella sp.]
MSEKIIKGKCLYTPAGAAREYAAIGCNFFRGCPFQCDYCYNRKGVVAPVMGIDHVVLEDCFTKKERRPIKYRKDYISDETYAMIVFKKELERNIDYFRKTGVFFSFSTDPMLEDTHHLTWRAANVAVQNGVPVTILTKCAETFNFLVDWFDKDVDFHKGCKELIAFGFTLTGRDDLEEGAKKHYSSNKERIEAMKKLKNQGYKVWASIEPIVDFSSSLKMIRESLPYCDHYKIGLMSKRSKTLPPYTIEGCKDFVFDVDHELLSAYSEKRTGKLIKAYWKESVRRFVSNDPFTMQIINNSPASVSRDWSIFTNK